MPNNKETEKDCPVCKERTKHKEWRWNLNAEYCTKCKVVRVLD